jgi:hypothetical protein
MARQHTAAERARFSQEHTNDYLWVEIMDTDGLWRDLSTLLFEDFVVTLDLDDSTEQNVVSGELVIRREGSNSLSPLMQGSLLNKNAAGAYSPLVNVGRPIRFTFANVDDGVVPSLTDKHEVLIGYTGDIMMGGKDDLYIHVPISDLGKRLVNTFIETERNYGSDVGTSLEVTEQAIINDNLPTTPLTALVAYWRFDGDATDVSGNARNGLVTNGATFGPGRVDRAINLDGVNDHVTVPDSAPLKWTGQDFSFFGMVNPDPTEVTGGYIISKPWNGSGQYNWQLIYNVNGTLTLNLLGATAFTLTTVPVAVAGRWHSVGFTIEAATKKVIIYLDGVAVATAVHTIVSWVPTLGDTNQLLAIGTLFPYGEGWAGVAAQAFDGQLDEFRILSRVVTSLEAAQLSAPEFFLTPVLNVPVPTTWQLHQYTQSKVSVMEAVAQLSTQIGYITKHKYDSQNLSKLTEYAPDRLKTISDDSFGPSEYFDVEELTLNEGEIRNIIEVEFVDRATGVTMFAYSNDVNNSTLPAPVGFGRRFMRLRNLPNIDSMVEAQTLAQSAYGDLSLPRATERVRLPHNWMVEVGDLHTLNANGVNYDVDQQRAIVSWHMHFENGNLDTTVTYRGKPAGNYYNWFHLEQLSTREGEEPPVLSVKLLDSSTNGSTDYQIDSTIPVGSPVTIFYAFGDDGFVLTVPNGGTISIPRVTNDSGDRTLRLKAISTNGLTDERTITVDYDTTPEIGVITEATPVYVNGVQTGWRLRGSADDDTRAVTILLTAGLAIGAGTSPGVVAGGMYWIDTRSLKTFIIELTQNIGDKGTATITPREFYNSANPGVGGQPFILTLERSAVSTASVREMSATQRDVTLTANPATATINYRINGGTWQTAVGKITFSVDVSAADQIIEWYSTTTLGTIEVTKRLVVDRDSAPNITSAVLTETPANNAHLELGFDDDVVSYRVWARRNAYPTNSGTLASITTNTSGVTPEQPLEKFLRYDSGMEKNALDWRAGGNGDGTSTWYVVIRAYDDVGNFKQVIRSILINGAPPAVGALANVRAQSNTESALRYNDVLWDHNATVEAGGYTVTVRENGVQVAIGRDPKLEHTGTSVTALVGGFHLQKAGALPGDPGAQFITFNYEVDLRRTSDNALIATYTASLGDWFAGGGSGGGGAAPTEIPNTLASFGEALQARGTWNNTNATAGIHLEWERWNGSAYVLYQGYDLAAGTATHTQTGLIAGDIFRFRLRYYNGYGNGTYSAYSAAATVLPAGSAPTEIPSSPQAQGATGAKARAKWTNTSTAYQIQVEWYDQYGGSGAFIFDRATSESAGTSLTAYQTFTVGDIVRFRAQYFNAVGAGPWSSDSANFLIHA